VLVPVDARSGTPVPQGTPGSILEAFKPGTEPGAGYSISDVDEPGAPTRASVQVGATPAGSGTTITTTVGTGTGGLY
jgi:penicillin-binding protein 1A